MAKTNYSFEVFPPKKFDKDGNPIPIETIYKTLDELRSLKPDFISVTYGAGGTDNCSNTLSIAKRIKDDCRVESVVHLPCINLTKDDARDILTRFKGAGIKNILALRGDRVPGIAPKSDFLHASDLIRFIKDFDNDWISSHSNSNPNNSTATCEPFKIFGACYPEKHTQAATLQEDIDNLKQKVDAGASHLLSQLFFDNEKFYNFLDKARAAGISVPIEAGIMPATNQKSIERMVSITNATLPTKFTAMMEHFSGNKAATVDAGINYAIDQITDLITHSVDGIHLYTMNNSYVARRITQAVEGLLGRDVASANDPMLKAHEYYEAHKAEYRQKYLGKYIVIYENEFRGAFDSPADALNFGDASGFRKNEFMVKKILEKDRLYNFPNLGFWFYA